jgi:DNA-binding NtrC family response regulator
VTGFLLNRSGFAVTTIRSHIDVLEAVSEHAPSIVILDCGDSVAAGARRVAALEALHPEVVVLVIAVADRTDAAQSTFRMVPKWCGYEQLLAEVGKASLAGGSPRRLGGEPLQPRLSGTSLL